MPIVRVEMWKGCSKEQKAEIAAVFAKEMERITHKPASYITIVFQDYETSDWALGGELASDIDWAKRRGQK